MLSSITDLLKFQASRSPDRPAICDTNGRALTFDEWNRLSGVVRDAIYDIGIRPSMRVGLVFERREWIDFAITFLGIVRAGAVAVLLSSEAKRMSQQLAQIEVMSVVCGAAVPQLEAGWVRFVDLVGRVMPVTSDASLAPHDIADVVFTSGTSGESVAIEYRHGDWIDSSSLRNPKYQRVSAHTNFLPCGTGGAHSIVIGHLTRGLTSVAIASNVTGDSFPEEANALLRGLCKYRPVELFMFPEFAAYLAASGMMRKGDFSSVRVIKTAGSPLLGHVGQSIRDALPYVMLVSLYGLSEGGRASLATIWDPRRPNALGVPFGMTKIRIVNGAGEAVRPGEIGELCVRVQDATGMTRRYTQSQTSLVAADGWTDTGDIVREDADGVICFVAREKDIIVGADGWRTVPSEVENVILSHPCVEEVSVVGLSSPGGMEEIIAAAVVSRCDDFELADLSGRLSELPEYSRPQRMLLADRLPRNTMGKVVRPEVRGLFLSAGKS